jgi:hypothetical protein
MKIIRKTWYSNRGTFLSGLSLSDNFLRSSSDVARGSSEVDLICLPLGARTEIVESKQRSRQVQVAIFNGTDI